MASENADKTARLLGALAQNKASAIDDLIAYFYDELKMVAASKMRYERAGHTLGTTGLLHEMFLRIRIDLVNLELQSRAAIFTAASVAMTRILVDYARRPRPRGGREVVYDVLDALRGDGIDIIDLNDALNAFAQLNPRQHEAIRMQFFVGLSVKEIANSLGLSESAVEKDLRAAKAWLKSHLTKQHVANSPDTISMRHEV